MIDIGKETKKSQNHNKSVKIEVFEDGEVGAHWQKEC